MRRNILKFIAVTGFVLTGFAEARSQSLQIDFVEQSGRNIVVHYNLDDGANSSRQFLVQLYSSQDNFTTALTRVSGDVGAEVNAGVDRKIVWDITNELGAFKGDVALELRGRVYVPFVKIKDIAEGQIFKHGKNYPLNWTSGNLSGQINIELFNARDERIWGENNVANVGKFDWYIPGNVKKGKDYRLKFTNSKDRNDVVYSRSFIIKPKIPLMAKIAGLAVIAVGVEVILSQKSKNSEAAPYGGPLAPPNN
jgi:hypothetical protein